MNKKDKKNNKNKIKKKFKWWEDHHQKSNYLQLKISKQSTINDVDYFDIRGMGSHFCNHPCLIKPSLK